MITIEGRILSDELFLAEGKKEYTITGKKKAFDMKDGKGRSLSSFEYSSGKDEISIVQGEEKILVRFHLFKPDLVRWGKKEFTMHHKLFGNIIILSGKKQVAAGRNDLLRMVFDKIEPEIGDIMKEVAVAIYIRYRIYSQNY
jgi:hypothetical protein